MCSWADCSSPPASRWGAPATGWTRRRRALRLLSCEPTGPRALGGPALQSADHHIGTLNEGSLHAQLKEAYAQPGDEHEVALDGFVIDLRRGDQLIEVQTTSFASMGRKLDHLLASYRILIVHPIAVTTFLHRPGTDHKPRRSPKRGADHDIFDELVSVPTLLDHPNLALEVVLVDVDKVQRHDPKLRRNRGGWRTVDRRLRGVVDRQRFESVDDLCRFVPEDLPAEFTTADLARAGGFPRSTAQRMAYCLRANGLFVIVQNTRAGMVYRLGPDTTA